MDNKKLGQEPAFPEMHDNTDMNKYVNSGISKRFYAACAAMQGLIGNPDSDDYGMGNGDRTDSLTNKVKFCYLIADELLKQEYGDND